ncbi:MAG TPA: hypothetical protein VGO40_10020 [Longimicrobium sp.]|jgi:hypothetical protein|nr:hypothetical protein [Longimicrobium sp.]
MKKLELSLDSLAIDSFETGATPRPEEGTVEAQAAPCTSPASCRCPTSVIRCGTIASTAYSCPVTFDC